MTREEIISNLLYMKRSVKEDTIEDMTINEAIKAIEQEPVMPVMYYPQVEGITPTVVEPCTNAISRQAVLDLAKFDGRKNLGSIIHAFDVEPLPPVTPQPCEDAISRQEAIDAIEDDARCGVYSHFASYDDAQAFKNYIKDLPTVKPAEKPNKWIPVSERLPEDHKDVLICLSSDQICIGSYNSHRLPFSNHAIGWGASYIHNWCSDDVIAWMPLPEPYKASPTGAEGSDKE